LDGRGKICLVVREKIGVRLAVKTLQ